MKPFIHTQTRRQHGFSLVEVLIAFGIFAIGAIAAASLFPVAALLQKETADDILGKHAAESAKAIVLAKGLTYDAPSLGGDLQNYHTFDGSPSSWAVNNSGSEAIPLFQLNPSLINKYSQFDRSYPSFQNTLDNRDLFWVPFVQDIQGDPNNPVWVMHIFILKRDSRASYAKPAGQNWANPNDIPGTQTPGFPSVLGSACTILAGSNDTTFTIPGHQIKVGDRILDSNGISYLVTGVNGNNVTIDGAILTSPNAPDTVWYAPPGAGGDGDSPTLSIITFSSDPNDPDSVQLVTDPTP